jgi:hypothetical protein
MNDYEFLDFTFTPDQKHVGIATIKLWGKLVLRFKIVNTKDGSGWFPACAAYKMPDPSGGTADFYNDAFMLDSRSEDEAVKNFIRSHVNGYLNKRNDSFGASVQAQQAPQQASPQYQQQTLSQQETSVQSGIDDSNCPF